MPSTAENKSSIDNHKWEILFSWLCYSLTVYKNLLWICSLLWNGPLKDRFIVPQLMTLGSSSCGKDLKAFFHKPFNKINIFFLIKSNFKAYFLNTTLLSLDGQRLSMCKQCFCMSKKTGVVLGCSTKRAPSRLKELILLFSNSDPHLECCAQFWDPQCKRDMELLERVQWRTIKNVEGPERLSCAEEAES